MENSTYAIIVRKNGEIVTEEHELFNLDITSGVLVGYNKGIVFAYAPGEWFRIYRIEDES